MFLKSTRKLSALQTAALLATLATGLAQTVAARDLPVISLPGTVDGFAIGDVSFVDTDGDGILEPGEGAFLTITLNNTGINDTTNVTATLAKIDDTVTVAEGGGFSTYPDLEGITSADNESLFYVVLDESHVCGEDATFELQIVSDQISQNLVLEIPTGIATPNFPVFTSTDVPKPLVDPGTQTSTIDVSGVFSLSDVDVSVVIAHTYVSDLTVTLISPAGLRILLIEQRGGNEDNIGTFQQPCVFDDQAEYPITAGAAPFGGTFSPMGALSALNGTEANGTWSLEVVDGFSGDSGSIDSWSLSFQAETRVCDLTVQPTPTATPIPTPTPTTTATPTATATGTTAVPTTTIPGTTSTPTATATSTTAVPTTTIPGTTTATPTGTPTATATGTTAVPTTTIPGTTSTPTATATSTTAVPTTTIPGTTTATPTGTPTATATGTTAVPTTTVTPTATTTATATTAVPTTTIPVTTVIPTVTPSTTVTATPTFTPTITLTPSITMTVTVTPSPTPIQPDGDEDRDGLTNAQEGTLNTNPRNKDTDGDGFEDGLEVAIGSDPLDPLSPADQTDSDNDGVPDSIDPDPNNPDSDGDRILDFYEIAFGSDPDDSGSVPTLGDANGIDGVNSSDAFNILEIFLGLRPRGSVPDEVLDINRDGVVDELDASQLFQFTIGVLPFLPMPEPPAP